MPHSADQATQATTGTGRSGAARDANRHYNAKAEADREQRWRSVRDEVWQLLEGRLAAGGRVAIVGSGHAHDVPLTRIAARAGSVHLVDLDPAASRGAVAREPHGLRERFVVVEEDVTGGAADRVVVAVRDGRRPPADLSPSTAPVAGGDFDLVIGDLLYTQLLYPALLALELPQARIALLLGQYDPILTGAVVERLHASAPDGVVLHLHDLALWTDTSRQPCSLDQALADPPARVPQLVRAASSDPLTAVLGSAREVVDTRHWRWPFKPGKEFLVRAVLAGARTSEHARSANVRNNAIRDPERPMQWRDVRDSLWGLVEPLLPAGGVVAIVGAGNADDVPLERIARRAGHVDLVDIDPSAARGAIARMPAELHARLAVVEEDVTEGAADLILAAARDGHAAPTLPPSAGRVIGGGEYDVVIGDMLYTQLLQAGLVHLGLTSGEEAEWMRAYDPLLTEALVRRLHESAPRGHVIHVHDLACWSDRQRQPLTLERVLEDPFWLASKLSCQRGCDPQEALSAVGARIVSSSWWRWPAGPHHTYLVRATVASSSAD